MKMYVPALALAMLIGAAAGPAFAAEESGQFQTSVPSDALKISSYYEQDVYDNQNNKIGDVKDVLLDKDGRVSAVIVGVGGVLVWAQRMSQCHSTPSSSQKRMETGTSS
jgi:sporulation protein YlmC with PRC-barrel domain